MLAMLQGDEVHMDTLGNIGFRQLFHRLVLLKAPGIKDLFVEDLKAPDGFDAVLTYPYIDRMAGLTFDVLAPARFDDERVFGGMALLQVQNRRMMLRRGGVPDETLVKIPRDVGALTETYAEHIAMIDEHYRDNEGVLATRRAEALDHLRNRDFPDDVRVLLAGKDYPNEEVWVRLMGIDEPGYPYGWLMNEPYSDFAVHKGDVLRLGITKDANDEFLLFAMDESLMRGVEAY